MADYQPIDLFKLSAGVRFDQWYKQALQANPRLVGMLFPTDDDVIKLMVGRAFRAPVTYEQKYFVEDGASVDEVGALSEGFDGRCPPGFEFQ